jgi:hypothetical protein
MDQEIWAAQAYLVVQVLEGKELKMQQRRELIQVAEVVGLEQIHFNRPVFLAGEVVLEHILRICILLQPPHFHMLLVREGQLELREQVHSTAGLAGRESLLLRSFINE